MNLSLVLCGTFIPSHLTFPLLLKRNGISLWLSYPLGKRENKGNGLFSCRRKPAMSSSALVNPFRSPQYHLLNKHIWPDVLRHRKRRCCSKIVISPKKLLSQCWSRSNTSTSAFHMKKDLPKWNPESAVKWKVKTSVAMSLRC